MFSTSADEDAYLAQVVLPRRAQARGRVAYYPRFTAQADYDNHFHRACWYLPAKPEVLEEVVLGVSRPFSRERRPDFMCAPRAPIDHIRDVEDPVAFLEQVGDAQLVMAWAPLSPGLERALKAAGIVVFNVDTDDPEAAEYGAYCKVHWRLTPPPGRDAALAQGSRRFRELAETVWSAGYGAAAVFGTGPSVDQAFEFDFSNCYTHACNTIVGDADLLGHISPDLISAGDVVSHFGVSTYAARFRRDLADYLSQPGKFFLTTAAFGQVLALQHPEIAGRIIVCNQTGPYPNFNLLERWGLPGLDSVLNIHMLPTACTFANRIYILGCDGKNPDEAQNEDFWAHSRQAQYHDLVDTGHKAHPTFDLNRRRTTWTRFQDSVRATLMLGETRYGKRFTTLAPSFTPGLDARYFATPPIRRGR